MCSPTALTCLRRQIQVHPSPHRQTHRLREPLRTPLPPSARFPPIRPRSRWQLRFGCGSAAGLGGQWVLHPGLPGAPTAESRCSHPGPASAPQGGPSGRVGGGKLQRAQAGSLPAHLSPPTAAAACAKALGPDPQGVSTQQPHEGPSFFHIASKTSRWVSESQLRRPLSILSRGRRLTAVTSSTRSVLSDGGSSEERGLVLAACWHCGNVSCP